MKSLYGTVESSAGAVENSIRLVGRIVLLCGIDVCVHTRYRYRTCVFCERARAAPANLIKLRSLSVSE